MNAKSSTGSKAKFEKAELNSLLHSIEREKKNEMRMHNTVKQQFKAKHSKLDFYLDNGKKSSYVKLYETHNPGFCFRRNGEAKPVQSSSISTSASATYQDIHDMLFTDGELDIDKVLCLHLLTAHKTETLTPPVRNHRNLSFLSKQQSPLERLIERSRKRRKNDNLTKLLPTYVLDVTDQDDESKKECLIRDGRLAERLIINDKIVQLVQTVLDALRTSNPDKMNELISKGKDENMLKKLVERPDLQEFLRTLRRQMVLSSCDSFHLTQPFKASPVPLKLTSSHSLKNLVHHIRKNVLQYPSQSTWRYMYDKSQYKEEYVEDDLSNERLTEKTHRKVELDTLDENVITVHSMSNSSSDASTSKSKPKQTCLRSATNDCERKKDDEKLKVKSNNKTIDAEKRDPKEFNVTYKNENATHEDTSVSENEDSIKTSASKKSTRKTSILTLDDLNDDNIKNVSLTELSRIINFHINKLTSDDKRAPKIEKQRSPSLRDCKNLAKGSGCFKSSIDAVGFTLLDLEKITQTIREKETEKKLTRFLENNKLL